MPKQPDSPPSVLPLNLCQVLEDEYAATQGAPAAHLDWDIEPDQLTANVVVDAWRAAMEPGSNASANPATAFSDHVLGLIRTQRGGHFAVDPRPDDRVVLTALNSLLSNPKLYNEQAVRGCWLSDEIHEYVRVHVSGDSIALSGEDLRRFNRLLLEDAYPGAVARIYRLRTEAIVNTLHTHPRAALCLSGGGIRSGTFSLGVLQGLARRGLLGQFHYLSTVSGGGYIGGWITAWRHRHPDGLAGVLRGLTQRPASKIEPEAEPLRHLREYSNFVAPRPSLASADVWSFVAIYIRNLMINWAALVPLALSVLLLPRLIVALLYVPDASVPPWIMSLLLVAGFALSVLAVFYITINRPSRADAVPPGTWWRKHREQGALIRYSLLPTVAAGVCLSVFWAWYKRPITLGSGWDLPLAPTVSRWAQDLLTWSPTWGLGVLLVVLGVAMYAVALLLAFSLVLRRYPQLPDLMAMVITGGGGGFFTWLLLITVFGAPVPPRTILTPTGAIYGCLAVPAYLFVFFCASAVFVAATSKRRADGLRRETSWKRRFAIEDEDREWLGRHGGWLFIMAFGWALASGLVVFGPLILLASPKLLSAFGGVSGVIALLGGKSALTAANDKNRTSPGWKILLVENALSIAAVLFLVILVAGLSLLSGWGLVKLIAVVWPEQQGPQVMVSLPSGGAGSEVSSVNMIPALWAGARGGRQLAVLYYAPVRLLTALVVTTAALGLLASLLINLNRFSLHGAYRSRIIRAFLGASRTATERDPNPFTGFDPQDNMQMHELWPGLLREASFRPGGLTAFVVRLRERQDPQSAALHDALSGSTQTFLQNHAGQNAPSQSLKRSLLEDVNRLLDGDPGLRGLSSFAELPVSDETRGLLRALGQRDPKLGIDQLLAGARTNRELGERLQGRRGLLLALNRTMLDSVYTRAIKTIDEPPPPYRLFHVIGTALNLVGGKRLDWQQRRAESFTISPLHSGSLYRGYRRSRNYGGPDGVSLGTAMTISGAAVSSNMGYHSSSAAVTLVLTFFNARLGWWLGNPGAAGSDRSCTAASTAAPYERAFPRVSLAPLCVEAFGLTDDSSRYVLLSDGGHFDNLGLYEMVLRRCRLIVVVDGSQDEKAAFDDLGAAVRKIRIDLGIDIAFEKPFQIYPKNHANAQNGKYCALATIKYAPIDGRPDDSNGVLLYVKPALRGDEPRDVQQYATANEAFPHQSTLDQLFDESQFESYRMLGSHIIDSVCPAGVGQTFQAFVTGICDEHLKVGTPDAMAPPVRGEILARLKDL